MGSHLLVSSVVYALMFVAVVGCFAQRGAASLAHGRPAFMFLAALPLVMLAVLFGVKCATDSDDAKKSRKLMSWSIAYFFFVMGVLTVVMAGCQKKRM